MIIFKGECSFGVSFKILYQASIDIQPYSEVLKQTLRDNTTKSADHYSLTGD
ncbi:hypothetical protein SAMN05428977_10748 [Nitrosomonas sp. Nm166]|nr:hypothetical protein SAMN05428977_10748 [Nitrosomonas sp. Nm166]